MLVWLIKHGENLPLEADVRPMRTWLLAKSLLARGHQVVWWTSTFSHQRKRLLAQSECTYEVSPSFQLRLLHAGSYSRNISLRRYLHHRRLGEQFRHSIEGVARPDAIVCSFPLIEFAAAATDYASREGVPIIVDVRDFWPDLYLERIPKSLVPLANFALASDFRQTYRALSRADSIVGISEGILTWGIDRAGRHRRLNDRVFPTGYPDNSNFKRRQTCKMPHYLEKLQDKTVFAFVGSFGTSYDLETVCAAARELHRSGEQRSHFVIAGDGEKRELVIKLTQDLPNVTIPGWLSASEIESLMAHAHVGLAPCISAKDSLPNKVYEYLCAGLPILSSLEGEMEQILAESDIGVSYQHGNVNELVSAVRTMLAGSQHRTLVSQRARKLFETKYRAQDIYASFAEHVEAAAAQPSLQSKAA